MEDTLLLQGFDVKSVTSGLDKYLPFEIVNRPSSVIMKVMMPEEYSPLDDEKYTSLADAPKSADNSLFNVKGYFVAVSYEQQKKNTPQIQHIPFAQSQ